MSIKKSMTIGAKTNDPLTVKRFGYGTMRLTGDMIWGEPKNRPEALQLLKTAISNGINFLDTADFYGEDVTSGLNYMIFRNGLYMESMALFLLGKDYMQKGVRLPAGDGKVSYAPRSDEAEAIGNVLSGDDCSNRIYKFTNPQTYSFHDVANAISELSGKTVAYTSVDMDSYKNNLKEQGMNEHMVEMAAPFMTDIKNGQGSTVSTDLEDALGRKPTGLKAGLKISLNL